MKNDLKQNHRTEERRKRGAILLTVAFFFSGVGLTYQSAFADDDLATGLTKSASWQEPSYEMAQSAVMQWLSKKEPNELVQIKVETIWPQAPSESSSNEPLLERLRLTLMIAVPETSSWMELIAKPRSTTSAPEIGSLETLAEDSFLTTHIGLLVGRWLCQNEFYDEASELLQDIEVEACIAPADLLFYRGVAAQQLLDKTTAKSSFERLLEHEGRIPRRFQRVAQLALDDVKQMEADSLDEIARLMNDVRRRQSLHRAGGRVLTREEEVVEKLSKLIDDLQDKANQQQQQAQASSSSSPTGQPMQSSQAAGGKGEGNVDRKSQTAGPQWGNLDPAARAAALAELSKDLPAHYREVIEDYFRKLAEDDKNR